MCEQWDNHLVQIHHTADLLLQIKLIYFQWWSGFNLFLSCVQLWSCTHQVNIWDLETLALFNVHIHLHTWRSNLKLIYLIYLSELDTRSVRKLRSGRWVRVKAGSWSVDVHLRGFDLFSLQTFACKLLVFLELSVFFSEASTSDISF